MTVVRLPSRSRLSDPPSIARRSPSAPVEPSAISRALSSDEFLRRSRSRAPEDCARPEHIACSTSTSMPRDAPHPQPPSPSLRSSSRSHHTTPSTSRLMLRTCSPALARPPLSVTIEAEARPSTLGPAASLPTPAPSPSRTGTALRLPLQSPSEASIQVSSVVVSGELESAACAPRGEEAGGVKVMLETLRDKGTLKGEEPLEVQPIPNLSKPFVLPPLETNPRLPKNLFDCTHTITLPDLPSTEPLPDPLLCDEDQVMVSLPSPISPTSASSLRRIRPRSSSREMTFPEPPVSSSLSAIQPRPDSATCEAPAYPLGMAPYRDPQSPLNLDPATLLANCGIRSGKRRQMNGLDTLRHLDHNAIVNAGGAAAAEDSDRYSKKRPALMTYTSFEDEFGLKPPRLITDEHNDEEESDHSEDKSDRKERKWWHLSG